MKLNQKFTKKFKKKKRREKVSRKKKGDVVALVCVCVCVSNPMSEGFTMRETERPEAPEVGGSGALLRKWRPEMAEDVAEVAGSAETSGMETAGRN